MASEQKEEVVAKRRPLPRIFDKELRVMMYGFGDDENPLPETVRLMEEIVLDYIANLAVKSTDIAHQHRRERPEVSDIKIIIRKDPQKLSRVRYLLEMKQEIRKATSAVEDSIEKTNAAKTNNSNNNANTTNNNTNNNTNNASPAAANTGNNNAT